MSTGNQLTGIAEFELDEPERQFRREVAGFVEDHVTPLDFRALEWQDDPHDRVPWEVIEAGADFGLLDLAVPEAYGGAGASTLELTLAAEELAVGDLGVAVIFDQNWKISGLIAKQADEALRERFFSEYLGDSRHLLAITATEPTTGSNNIIPYSDLQFDTTAERDGDEWVINGEKHYISNGADAKTYVVRAQTDTSVPATEGATQFLVPRDTDGLEVTHIHEKISQRLINNATIEFTDVRVPAENVLGAVNEAMSVRTVPNPGHIEAGATTLGVARAAYENAYRYANEREQGGTEIINHQTIAHDLAEMAMELQAARSLLWSAARAADRAPDYDYPLDSMAKVFAAEVSVDITKRALEMFGGSGIMLGTIAQKYHRDALSFLHSDGTQRAHLEKVSNHIRGVKPWE